MTTDHMELRAVCASTGSALRDIQRFPSVTVTRLAIAELLAAYDALVSGGATVKRGKKEYPAEFSAAYDAMKDYGAKWREGSTPAAAYDQWKKRIKAGASGEQMLAGAQRYAAYIKATAGEPKMAQTFFGPGEHYTAEWVIGKLEARWPFPASSQGRAPFAQQADAKAQASAEAKRRLMGDRPDDGMTFDMESPR